jgi:hypothetical protein
MSEPEIISRERVDMGEVAVITYIPGEGYACSIDDAHDAALKAAGQPTGKPWRGQSERDWQHHVDHAHRQARKDRKYFK